MSLHLRIDGPLSRELLRLAWLPSKVFLCSLERSFSSHLTRGHADEIVVISPFFDNRQSAEPTTQDSSTSS